MEINIFEGEMDKQQEAIELRRIADLIEEGYAEGEVFHQDDYRGWWKK